MPLAPDPTATLALPMPETAPPPVVAEPTAAADDAVSPELVLVDPSLRDRLAALPPAPLAPRPSPKPPPEPPAAPAAPPSTPPPSAEPIRVAPEPPEPPPVAPIEHPRRRRWPLLLAAVVGAGLTAGATIILLPQSKSPRSAHVAGPGATGHIGTPTSSAPPPAHTATTSPRTTHHSKPSTTPNPPAQTTRPRTTAGHPTTPPARTTTPATPAKPKPKPSTTPSSPPPVAGGRTTHEKLAWAPAAGATAYEMDLLRGSKRVFHVRTRQTSLIITVRTGAKGPAGSLPPGDYEWIVWPIVGGHKGQPTVRSRLTLPG